MSFSLGQRDDSAAVLALLQECFGGLLTPVKGNAGAKPQVVWWVRAEKVILSLIEYFDAHPLVVKLEEYEVWREAALFYYRHSVGHAGKGVKNPDWLIEAMRAYAAELSELKKYKN